ncbi:MAG: hypothetical protein AAB728_04895, partial [Patescibacteria group bacterium]
TLSLNATLRQTGDTVTIEVVKPDGSSEYYARKIHPPRVQEMTATERQQVTESHRIQTLRKKIEEYAGQDFDWSRIDPPGLPEPGTVDPAAAKLAADIVLKELGDKGIGNPHETGIAVLRSTALASSTDEVVQQLLAGRSPNINLATHQYDPNYEFQIAGVNANSAMGRIFLGLVQALLPHADFVFDNQSDTTLAHTITNDPRFNGYDAMARLVEQMTGISRFRILHAAHPGMSYLSREAARENLVAGLRALFVEAQYGSIFAPTSPEGTT